MKVDLKEERVEVGESPTNILPVAQQMYISLT